MWDPEYNVFWAIGKDELVSYTVSGSGESAELILDTSRGGELPTLYGHDLSADFTNVNGLWLTSGSNVYYFNKGNNSFTLDYENRIYLNRSNVKGFSNNSNGNYFYCFPNGGPDRAWANDNISAWCTDTIYYVYYDKEHEAVKGKICVSETAAFYKAISFYGEYQ